MPAVAYATLKDLLQRRSSLHICALLTLTLGVPSSREGHLSAKTTAEVPHRQQETTGPQQSPEKQGNKLPFNLESTEDWNRRLRERSVSTDAMPSSDAREYAIGPDDVLDISVFEAQEMNREVRVSASGEISLPLLGAVRAAGLTPRELETSLEELLREKYMKGPHVGVFVHEMQSHPVSVMGAVRKPGIFQIRGRKTLLEILSLAEGLADDAGEDVIILRGAGGKDGAESLSSKSSGTAEALASMEAPGGPGATYTTTDTTTTIPRMAIRVNLKDLLDSSDPRHNPAVYPGDIVKVSRAGIVYVVGAVQRSGGFAMKTNEKISVLQALALSEGLTRTAAKGRARIIHTNEQNGARTETSIDLGKILSGKFPDPMLEPRDIMFIPDSAARTTFSRGVEAAAQTLTGLLIFHW